MVYNVVLIVETLVRAELRLHLLYPGISHYLFLTFLERFQSGAYREICQRGASFPPPWRNFAPLPFKVILDEIYHIIFSFGLQILFYTPPPPKII